MICFPSRHAKARLISNTAAMAILLLASTIGAPSAIAKEPGGKPGGGKVLFSDVHFHLTNYVQKGITASKMLALMGDSVGRVALFGIPLQQKWDAFVSGDRAPNYYLLSDAKLYYYSFTDAIIASEYGKLTPAEQKRFDPMITGFNPTDMWASDHILKVLELFPGVFSGIGEFSIHKEFVSSKLAGHTASLKNKALDRILDVAGKTGLVALVHCDINTVRFSQRARPAHFDDLKAVLLRHPMTTIIWAHTGLGRFVKPTDDHIALLTEILIDPRLAHVNFDISWDEVAKYVVREPATTKKWADLLNAHPNRFLFGSDSVAPGNAKKYIKTYRNYDPLWALLSPNAKAQVTTGNYARIFDAANEKVRAFEATSAKKKKVLVKAK